MSEWNKEGSMRSEADRRKLDDIHLAVCGNPELGVAGLVQDMAQVKARIIPLEEAKNGTITVWKSVTIVGSLVVGVAVIAGSIVAVFEFIVRK